jgi:outer membrane protein assembly factor BamB
VSYLKAVNQSGTILWSRQLPQTIDGDVPIVNGVAFTGIGNKFVALNLKSGAILWTYKGTTVFNPSPAIVPSGVYTADDGGNVYAFSLPK